MIYYCVNKLFTYCNVGSVYAVVVHAMCHQSIAVLNKNHMERLCILPADVCKITGKKIRYAQQLIKKLKMQLNKKKHQFITKKELAAYLDIDENSITLD